MGEMHKRFYDAAVKLSIYSSILDFGLMLSVLGFQKNYLPAAEGGFFINLFDQAIAYVTLTIMALFVAALALKYKGDVVKIYTRGSEKTPHKNAGIPKMMVYQIVNAKVDPETHTTIKLPPHLAHEELEIQRVVNSKSESFIKLNGIWYKYVNGRFEQTARPDYA